MPTDDNTNGSTPAPMPTATDPKTGERWQFANDQWIRIPSMPGTPSAPPPGQPATQQNLTSPPFSNLPPQGITGIPLRFAGATLRSAFGVPPWMTYHPFESAQYIWQHPQWAGQRAKTRASAAWHSLYDPVAYGISHLGETPAEQAVGNKWAPMGQIVSKSQSLLEPQLAEDVQNKRWADALGDVAGDVIKGWLTVSPYAKGASKATALEDGMLTMGDKAKDMISDAVLEATKKGNGAIAQDSLIKDIQGAGTGNDVNNALMKEPAVTRRTLEAITTATGNPEYANQLSSAIKVINNFRKGTLLGRGGGIATRTVGGAIGSIAAMALGQRWFIGGLAGAVTSAYIRRVLAYMGAMDHPFITGGGAASVLSGSRIADLLEDIPRPPVPVREGESFSAPLYTARSAVAQAVKDRLLHEGFTGDYVNLVMNELKDDPVLAGKYMDRWGIAAPRLAVRVPLWGATVDPAVAASDLADTLQQVSGETRLDPNQRMQAAQQLIQDLKQGAGEKSSPVPPARKPLWSGKAEAAGVPETISEVKQNPGKFTVPWEVRAEAKRISQLRDRAVEAVGEAQGNKIMDRIAKDPKLRPFYERLFNVGER